MTEKKKSIRVNWQALEDAFLMNFGPEVVMIYDLDSDRVLSTMEYERLADATEVVESERIVWNAVRGAEAEDDRYLVVPEPSKGKPLHDQIVDWLARHGLEAENPPPVAPETEPEPSEETAVAEAAPWPDAPQGEDLEAVADRYLAVAQELVRAAQHCRTAADHFRERRPPRGAAHAFAAQGHLSRADAELTNLARIHADRSTPAEKPE